MLLLSAYDDLLFCEIPRIVFRNTAPPERKQGGGFVWHVFRDNDAPGVYWQLFPAGEDRRWELVRRIA